MKLKDKVAIVTGGASGIGAATARLFAAEGARVVLVDRDASGLAKVAAEIPGALTIEADVGDNAQAQAGVARVMMQCGRIDVLMTAAGISLGGTVDKIDEAAWDRTFDVNVRGVFFAAQAAARLMLANGAAERAEARIVNIASIASHTVLPGLSAYNASKASVAMLTRSLAREWSRRGIAVNALCPGYILTDINAGWCETDGGQKQLKGFPRRRLMDAEDLDAAFMMLCGPAARTIAGSVITIDDGQSLPGGG